MAWPKKGTHRIVINGEGFLWRQHKGRNSWVVIKKEGAEGQLLFVNPYHHDLPFGHKPVNMAVAFARFAGWAPTVKRAPMKLSYNGDDYAGDPFTMMPADWKLPGR